MLDAAAGIVLFAIGIVAVVVVIGVWLQVRKDPSY